jgi:hypothetical protein
LPRRSLGEGGSAPKDLAHPFDPFDFAQGKTFAQGKLRVFLQSPWRDSFGQLDVERLFNL